MKELTIACFGEVLWDIFPTHKKIGGAPLNVAIRLKSLNNNVSIISRVGKDDLGSSLLEFIDEKGVNINNVQADPKLKTGEVKVMLDDKGSASYEISFPRAWDQIEITDSDKELVKKSDAFIFGSLIGRHNTSKNTLSSLLEMANYKIFDVNLRAPYYSIELLVEFMNQANFIKFNDDELQEISICLGSQHRSIEQNIKFIANKTNTAHICVTRGKDGAVLFYNENLYYNEGYSVNVIDTVGAGDSFLATLINGLLKNKHPQNAIDIACAVGAIVTQHEGANPKITTKDVQSFLDSKS
ncbi:carbohydrate kinase [Psychroserpens sp. AS72]|uniref:carbohydrate kinase family protein n=1 Tax=Psychroserpens sp. AS72 TaxID=3135775 RepID=UPI00317B0BBD